MKTIEELADKLAATVGAHLFYKTEGSAKEMAEALKEYETLRPQPLWPATNYNLGFAYIEGDMPPGVLGMVLSRHPGDPDFDPKKHVGIVKEI